MARGFQGFAVRGFGGNEGLSGQVRGFGGRTPGGSNAMKYRKDYGWRMDQQGYDAMEQQREEFEGKIGAFRRKATGQIQKAKGDYESQRGAFESEISSARQKLGSMKSIDDVFQSWYNKEKIPVQVVHGNTVEGTYYAPRSVMEEFHRTKGDLMANWVEGGKVYNIEVRQQGRIRGQEMHDLMRNELANRGKLMEAFVGNPKVAGEYSDYLTKYGAAKRQLETAEAKGRQALNQMNQQIRIAEIDRDTQIGKATSARQGQLDAARQAYLDAREARQKAYRGLAGAKWEKK